MQAPRAQRIGCALAILAGQAIGQPESPPVRPRAADRVVRVFDFEERLTNATGVPEGWVRAQHDPLVPRLRPEFPIWNQGRLDFNVAASGEGSVRLDVRGGSASLRMLPGVVPVFPTAEYKVRARVRAEDLMRSRPRLVARLLDSRAQPIPGTERSVLIEEIGADWAWVELHVPGRFENAAHLQIDLELVQERLFADPLLGQHQIWEEDVKGSAWFDDVSIVQVPQVGVGTPAPLNIVSRPDRPTIIAEVRDLTGQPLRARISLYNARRELVDTYEQPLSLGNAHVSWDPEIDELGWYRAFIDVLSDEGLVSSKSCDIVWLDVPPEPASRYHAGPIFAGAQTNAMGETNPPGAIALEIDELPPLDPDTLTGAIHASGVTVLSLPLWERAVTAESMSFRVDRLREIATTLRADWIEPVLALPAVPDEIATRQLVTPRDVLGVLDASPLVWEPYLLDATERLGTSLSRWQIGSTIPEGVEVGLTTEASLRSIREMLLSRVPGVEIDVGWRADLSPRPVRTADGARVRVPHEMAAGDLGMLAAAWAAAESEPTFVLEPLPTDTHLERDVAAELARRAATLWRHSPADDAFDLALAGPWTIDPGDRGSARPTAALAAWRAIADRLSGRVFVGEWDWGPGTTCLVFTPADGAPKDRGGMIVAWSRGDADAMIESLLGPGPVTAYDVFGNGTEHEAVASEDGARNEHRIALGSEPVFIEGIDTDLVRFLSLVALDPPLLESSFGERTHALVLRNTWSTPISGELVVSEPGGFDPDSNAKDRSWEITPRVANIELGPGEEQRIPLALLFSRSAESGEVPFAIDMKLRGDEEYGWVRARPRAVLDWDAVEMHLSYRPVAGDDETDLIVEAIVTNRSDTPRALEAVAFAPNQPRGRSAIGTLGPGESIVRRFAFRGAFDQLAGERVFVALTEPEGTGRLNKSIEIPAR